MAEGGNIWGSCLVGYEFLECGQFGKDGDIRDFFANYQILDVGPLGQSRNNRDCCLRKVEMFACCF